MVYGVRGKRSQAGTLTVYRFDVRQVKRAVLQSCRIKSRGQILQLKIFSQGTCGRLVSSPRVPNQNPKNKIPLNKYVWLGVREKGGTMFETIKLHLVENNHFLGTRIIKYKSFTVPTVRTMVFGTNSIKFNSIQIWNSLNKKFYFWKLFERKRNFCKEFIKNHFLEGSW